MSIPIPPPTQMTPLIRRESFISIRQDPELARKIEALDQLTWDRFGYNAEAGAVLDLLIPITLELIQRVEDLERKLHG